MGGASVVRILSGSWCSSGGQLSLNDKQSLNQKRKAIKALHSVHLLAPSLRPLPLQLDPIFLSFSWISKEILLLSLLNCRVNRVVNSPSDPVRALLTD